MELLELNGIPWNFSMVIVIPWNTMEFGYVAKFRGTFKILWNSMEFLL